MVHPNDRVIDALEAVGQTAGHRGVSGLGISPALPAHVIEGLRPLLVRHAVIIAPRHHARHIVHAGRCHCLDALVGSHGVQRHTAEATNADNADTLAVHGVVETEVINSGHKVLGIDDRRRHIAHLTAAFASEGGVDSERDEAALGHGLGIETGRLFLYRTERPRDSQRRHAPITPVLGQVEITHKSNTISVCEADLLVIDVFGLGENLVPLIRHGLCLCS